MSIKKYLSLERLAEYDALLKAKIAQDNEATLGAAKEYADGLIDGVNTSISNITNGDVVVKEAEHATSADSATSAESAVKATQDGNGAVIADTYETKDDAASKLTEAKEYVDGQIESHAHSWNDLEDKPTEFIGGYTFTNTGEHTAQNGRIKVSDVVLSLEDFANGYSVTLETGEVIEYTADNITVGNILDMGAKDALQCNNDYFIILPKDSSTPSGTTFTKGVYFYAYPTPTHTVTVRGKEEKFKEDFIPDTIARVEDVNTLIESHVHSWNDLEDKPFGHEDVYEVVVEENTYSDGDTLLVEDYRYNGSGGKPGTFKITIDNTDVYTFKYAQLSYLGTSSDSTCPFHTEYAQGKTTIRFDDGQPHVFKAEYLTGTTTKLIDESFIPDTIARVSDIPVVDLTPYETKTDAAGKLTEAKSYADGKFDALSGKIGTVPDGQTVMGIISNIQENAYDDTELVEKIDGVDAKVTTLVGSDANKSVRTIANEELAKQLVADGAQESLDTLAEIAAWIQQHPADAAAMNEAIVALQNKVDTGNKTVSAYVTDAIAALSIGDYAKAADLTALANRVSALETASATHALKTDVDEVSDALDEYKTAHAGDYTNAQIDEAIKAVSDEVAAFDEISTEEINGLFA